MNDNVWVLATGIFLACIVFLCLVLYLLGYRLTKRGKPETEAKPTISKAQPLTINQPADQAYSGAVAQALSELDDGLLIMNERYQVEHLNAAAARIFSLHPDMCKGLTFIEVVRDYECDALLRKCVETRQKQVSMIRTHLKKQLLSITAFPGWDNGNYIVIVKDFTERYKVEQIQRDLISNLAHEFRTPLASIRLLTETLLQGSIKEPKVSRGFLQKIDVESAKLQHMTEDLSELSMIESSELTLEKSAVDMEGLIRQTRERLSIQSKRKGVPVQIIIEHGMPAAVIDRARVECVLMNLLHNAIKYTSYGGQISIDARMSDAAIKVSVKDTGIGIPAEELPRVFERFYKVDKARNSEGSGLGLAISKQIIASHGGEMWAESAEGKGSTFWFTLPLQS